MTRDAAIAALIAAARKTKKFSDYPLGAQQEVVFEIHAALDALDGLPVESPDDWPAQAIRALVKSRS